MTYRKKKKIKAQIEDFLSKKGRHFGGWYTHKEVPRSLYRLIGDFGYPILNAVDYLKIDVMIQEASLEDCYSSRDEYIIKTKEWMKKNDLQEQFSIRWMQSNDEDRVL